MTTDNARKGTTGATAPRDERTSSTLTPYERAQAASLEALTLGAEARDTVALFAARAANLRAMHMWEAIVQIREDERRFDEVGEARTFANEHRTIADLCSLAILDLCATGRRGVQS